jgi:hypothetical protein
MALIGIAVILSGCLGEPEIEDGWTRLDMHSENITPRQPLSPGGVCSVSVSTAITYRSIITGFAVTELRASTTISPAGVTIAPDADRLLMAQDIDNLLQNSVSVGRATRAVTGWDHLIQQIDFNFVGWVPTLLDSSTGTTGPPAGLFLVSYLGEGEEIELADGSDSLVVTPFISTDYEVLPVGMEVAVSGGPVP